MTVASTHLNAGLQWRKSPYSADAANCVCLATAPDGTVLLRDSKAPAPIVAASAEAVSRFVGAVAAGWFDGPRGRV
ncbi:DUF397 domain-containing protein [Streptomyces sp. NPDC006307]|uniref:DUF397 domain-containing protein n=1 Tax=Streptomyces sp. NPDC006307 TaxID=3156748 RepID=UPI0033A5BE9D